MLLTTKSDQNFLEAVESIAKSFKEFVELERRKYQAMIEACSCDKVEDDLNE